MRRRSFPIAAVILTAAVGVTGPTPSQAVSTGSARDGSAPALRPATPLPDEVHVDVTDFRFTPATVALPRGGTIVFEHLGPSHHSATDATGMQLYDSGVVDPSSPPTSYTFAAAGVYPFVCTPHPFMGGRVNVPVRAAPATGPATERRTITWSTGPAPDGFVYDVQVHRPGTGWSAWRTGVASPSASFRADAGTGRYRFRARLREPGVASSRWSQPATIRVG